MTNQTNNETVSLEVKMPVEHEVSEDLKKILIEMSNEINLGDDFSKLEYFNLFLIGLILPALLMIGGWFL
ncbi:hypothetical protein BIV60_10600 [Bacillus sp. MUM 116]|uniref:hypothetical protein n=1 Tax=Bacillus sp. MUM 116 TaxID=1678002 RepID=UPI0008F584E0|nr:hypothetical protein [Bacillus sp. MUM 116]OIK14975.1 hypothetical protein BIV60_10600 [Bacillus sp. MUM 116]